MQGRYIDENEKKFYAGTVIDPTPRIRLEDGSSELTMRAMDLIAPIGMGQRGLIVAPPGSGKTTFLKHLCQAISKSAPSVKLYCLLIDERPEEVTDFRRSVPSGAEVRWSSSDETYEHHISTADVLMKQVYREVAGGANVMVLIDSLTRLTRVHNADMRSSGRTLSGGVDARALEIPRRIFGAARKIENGGSLSILATILVSTGSRMDDIIFEEFKGTGNMEIYLSAASTAASSISVFSPPSASIRAARAKKNACSKPLNLRRFIAPARPWPAWVRLKPPKRLWTPCRNFPPTRLC